MLSYYIGDKHVYKTPSRKRPMQFEIILTKRNNYLFGLPSKVGCYVPVGQLFFGRNSVSKNMPAEARPFFAFSIYLVAKLQNTYLLCFEII